jgi:hypothetical protein
MAGISAMVPNIPVDGDEMLTLEDEVKLRNFARFLIDAHPCGSLG